MSTAETPQEPEPTPPPRIPPKAVLLRAIDDALRGSDSARNQLYKWFWPIAFVMVRRFLPHHSAEDVAANAIVQVFGPLPRGRQPSIVNFDRSREFLPWFCQALTHKAIDYIRSETKRRDREAQVAATNTERARDATRDPAAVVIDAEAKERVADFRKTYLSPEQNALVERWLEDETYAEMAECFGVPPGTIGSRLHSIVDKMRKFFDEQS